MQQLLTFSGLLFVVLCRSGTRKSFENRKMLKQFSEQKKRLYKLPLNYGWNNRLNREKT